MRNVYLSYGENSSSVSQVLVREVSGLGGEVFDGFQSAANDEAWQDKAVAAIARCSNVTFIASLYDMDFDAKLRLQLGVAMGAGRRITWFLPLQDEGSLLVDLTDLVKCRFVDFDRLSQPDSSEFLLFLDAVGLRPMSRLDRRWQSKVAKVA